MYREEKRVQYVWLNSQIKMTCKLQYYILKLLHNILDAISCLLEIRAGNYYRFIMKRYIAVGYYLEIISIFFFKNI